MGGEGQGSLPEARAKAERRLTVLERPELLHELGLAASLTEATYAFETMDGRRAIRVMEAVVAAVK